MKTILIDFLRLLVEEAAKERREMNKSTVYKTPSHTQTLFSPTPPNADPLKNLSSLEIKNKFCGFDLPLIAWHKHNCADFGCW